MTAAPATIAEPAQERLEAEAQAAADRAGVEVRELRSAETGAASRLFEQVWRSGPGSTPMEPGLLVALSHAGSCCTGAFRGDTLVGACVGFFGQPLGEVLHSHIAAVAPGLGLAGVGTALKRHQRAWSGRRGLSTIAWTYDPLIARNAWFNLGRLGAHPVGYLVDFYGDMDDGVNAGQGSDRLLVHWPVRPEDPPPRPGGPACALLAVGPGDEPQTAPPPGPMVAACTLAVPADIEGLRERDRGLGVRWRHAFRTAYLALTEQGWTLTAFGRDGRYRMERTP